MRAGRGIALMCAVLALAGCASIPTSGPVREGAGVVEESDSFVPFAEGPRPGDSPTAIVTGFLQAIPQGFASDFTVAREFLTPEASLEWDPYATVTIFDSRAIPLELDEGTGAITYTVPVAATVDSGGRLTEAPDGADSTLQFVVTQDADGEYRIAGLEDGSLIAEANFTRLFRRVDLVFAASDGVTMVEEARFLPALNAATRAASELVAGPSEWLADAVVSGLGLAAELEVDSVVVTDGVAAVRLGQAAAGTFAESALAYAQLEATLTALPEVTSIEVTVGGVPLDGDEAVDLAQAPTPDEVAAALVRGRLALWDGEQLRVTPDDVGRVPDAASGLALAYSGGQVAMVVGSDRLVVSDALAGGVASLVPAGDVSGPPSAPMEMREVYAGTDLVDPSYDRHGWLWTAETAGDGVVVAVPAAGVEGEGALLDAPWLAGRDVRAIAVSRDGARLAISSRTAGQTVIEVAGVVRDPAGVPTALTGPIAVGAKAGEGASLSWLDEMTLAVLGRSDDGTATPLWLVTVGGFTEALTADADAVAVSSRHGEATLTVITADGEVQVRAGASWAISAEGVSDLAYSG
ncbi:LpqB family beta-propeller domain-containing protein [Demequina sp. NBRC 110052]|uniref:LpqB family beta-propeller domain-containing protein n=1 Tax=Demequina sp. NBRC 110052 TaxID=1570341 RepID=UPI00117D9883|nr:LpqB family beta-propeller domain-containing protein [Demequina sp. NBRC 110052]